jgi:hypothetical protein
LATKERYARRGDAGKGMKKIKLRSEALLFAEIKSYGKLISPP